mgnify:CR=1 FL=1
MSFDPTDMNAKDAIMAIHNLTSTEDLLAAQAAEEAGDERKTVLAAISVTLANIADEAEKAAEEEAEEAMAFVEKAMKVRPTWALDLPLDCEGGYARSYGEC